MRIAIIKLGALGDVVRTTGILQPLRHKYPDCQIDWYTEPSCEPLLRHNPFIAEIRTPTRPSSNAYDLVISLDEEMAACELASHLGKKQLIGTHLVDGKPAYTPSSAYWFDMSLLSRDADGSLKTANARKQRNTQTYQQILFDMLELPGDPARAARPLLFLQEGEKQKAALLMEKLAPAYQGPRIGLATHAGLRWPTKQLTIPKTLELIAALRPARYTNLVLFGGEEERDRNTEILRAAGPGLANAGTDHPLREFAALIGQCSLLITSDSLAMHLAVALGCPCIVFFGPTSIPEIELFGIGWKWLPKNPCLCYYRPACTQPVFCLDSLDCVEALAQIPALLAHQTS